MTNNEKNEDGIYLPSGYISKTGASTIFKLNTEHIHSILEYLGSSSENVYTSKDFKTGNEVPTIDLMIVKNPHATKENRRPTHRILLCTPKDSSKDYKSSSSTIDIEENRSTSYHDDLPF